MYCKNCGKEIDENAVVCPNCGCARMIIVQPKEENSQDDKKNKIARILYFIGFVLLCIAVVVFIKSSWVWTHVYSQTYYGKVSYYAMSDIRYDDDYLYWDIVLSSITTVLSIVGLCVAKKKQKIYLYIGLVLITICLFNIILAIRCL